MQKPVESNASSLPDYEPAREHRVVVEAFSPDRTADDRRSQLDRLQGLVHPPIYGRSGIQWVERRRVTKPEGTMVRLDVIDEETGVAVPCWLGLPATGSKPYPVMVCLQGHSNGMHVSLGVSADDPEVDEPAPGDRDIARQCMARGIAALCVEQRGFGLRRDDPANRVDCTLMAMRALTLGRTLVGERVADVRLALDALTARGEPDFDLQRLGIMGNSAGGTTAMFASVMDERFQLAVASCSFAPLATSWLFRPHCVCGYVPRMLEFMDLPEMMALRAPKPVVVVGAAEDYHVAEADLRAGFERLHELYVAAGVPDACRLAVGPEGHRFYADLAWPLIHALL